MSICGHNGKTIWNGCPYEPLSWRNGRLESRPPHFSSDVNVSEIQCVDCGEKFWSALGRYEDGSKLRYVRRPKDFRLDDLEDMNIGKIIVREKVKP